MQELISIIIPVYNAEKYIVPCLDSLLAQTYLHWEAILVNDGSSDSSFQILNDYAQKDARFRVLHQENQGVSAARNAGLALAQGSFVAFIDADDYVKPDYLAVLTEKALTHNADMVCCNFIEVLNGEIVHLNVDKVLCARSITTKKELLTDFISCKEAYGTCVWAKLIRTSLAKQTSFKPLKFGEDSEYMFRLFLQAPTVYLDLYQGYYYIRNESSATMQNDEKSVLRCANELHMAKLLADGVPEDCKDIYPLYHNRYATAIHSLATATVLAKDQTLYKQHRKQLRELIREALHGPTKPGWKNRILLGLYYHTPWLYRLLMQLRQGN